MEAEAAATKWETWTMQRPDSIFMGRRRGGGGVAQIFFPLEGAIHSTAVGLSRQKRGVAEFLLNSAKMSGGLNKADYKRLIHIVSQNNPQ